MDFRRGDTLEQSIYLKTLGLQSSSLLAKLMDTEVCAFALSSQLPWQWQPTSASRWLQQAVFRLQFLSV